MQRTFITNIVPKKSLVPPDYAEKLGAAVEKGIKDAIANAQRAAPKTEAAPVTAPAHIANPMFPRQGGGLFGNRRPTPGGLAAYKLPKAEG